MLLQGGHQCNDSKTTYFANPRENIFPVFESNANLTKLFGRRKFRKLAPSDAARILKLQTRKIAKLEASEVQKAAEQGFEQALLSGQLDGESEDLIDAEPVSVSDDHQLVGFKNGKGITQEDIDSLGTDATDKFENAAGKDVMIFMKPGGRYSVVGTSDEGELVLLNPEGPLKKANVVEMIDGLPDVEEE